jgi:hypothetical protein
MGFRGSKGFRVASPFVHMTSFATMFGMLFFILCYDRSEIVSLPPPPCEAPPPVHGAAIYSLTPSMEMPYRRDTWKPTKNTANATIPKEVLKE